MKHSAARTLGVAALGAAFAVVAAGTASASVLPTDAAATALPVAGSALGAAAKPGPVEETATKLLGTGQQKLVGNVTAPAKGLLGGLPAGGAKTGGLPAGIPLG